MTAELTPGRLKWHDNGAIATIVRPRVRHVIIATVVAIAHPMLARGAGFQDASGQTVTVPANPKHVVPAGAPAQVLIQALAPALLAGLVEPFKPEHATHVDQAIAALPQIPMLNRTDAPGDVAAVAALKPDLVIDYGNASARYVAADAKIQQELAVPTALIGGSLENAASAAATLGDALGLGPRGKAISDLVGDVLARAQPVTTIADTDRVGIYVARGQDGVEAIRGGTSFDEPIHLAGGRNVVTAAGGAFQHMSVDQVVALKPNVVVFAERDALSSPLHAALPKGTIFVLDQGEPYKVLTGPPSINRLVALAALPAILHPGKVKPDPAFVMRVETTLFPAPPGGSTPQPLQVQ